VSLFFDHGVDANLFFPEDAQGWTPMHYAAKNGSLTVLLALISRGAGVDPPDNNQKTPLIVAMENAKVAVARSLIELGADIEARDSMQRTPLMCACKSGSKEAVELLL
jgi:ankyrin repeat protein